MDVLPGRKGVTEVEKKRERLFSGFRLVCMVIFLVIPAIFREIGAEGSQEDLERRIGEIGKKLEEAEKRGRIPPRALMEELARILEEMQGGEEQNEEDEGREQGGDGWTEVPFTGTISITRTVSGSARMPQDSSGSEGSGGAASWSAGSSGTLSATITGSEEIRDGDGNLLGWQPVGRVTGRTSDFEEFRGGGFSSVSRYSASEREEHSFDPGRSIDGWCRLSVNASEGRYSLSFPSIWLGGGEGKSVITVVTPDFTHREEEPWKGIGPLEWLPVKPEEDDLRYDPEKGSISGSFTWHMPPGGLDMAQIRKEKKKFPLELAGMKGEILKNFSALSGEFAAASGKVPHVYSGTWTAAWSLQLGRVPVRVELETLGDYEKWIPNLVGGMGNFLRVKARIVEPAGLEGRIEFCLEDVSEEPGECLNHPRENPGSEPDLVISPLGGPALKILEDGRKAVTEDGVNEADVVVQARDYGAWGRLSAVARVTVDGKEKEVRAVFPKTGEHWVTIPRDENGNSIADSWEEEHGIPSCPGDADDDGEPSGKAPGDGISAYEEYRGFFAGGNHVRLDPTRKDLFVHDPDGLAERADFGGVTRLVMRCVSGSEGRCDSPGKGDRVVNFNSGRHHLVDQHCLWIKKESLPSPERFNWGACMGGDEIGPPRTADPFVLVFVDQIREDISRVYLENRPEISNALGQKGLRPDGAWLDGQVAAAVAMVTLHEGCHGLGIGHHYKSLRKTLPKTKDVEEAVKNMDINPSTGQMSCVMRYIWDGGKHPRLSFRGDNELLDMLRGRPWPHTLCETMDDCRGQMVVSDRETGQFF